MLRYLQVKNLAVIAEAAVELGPGLNVLTGETGAGKSIVVDALALLSGARASTELIRSGTDALTVTGVFAPVPAAALEALESAGLGWEGDQLVVRREVSRGAANRVFVNDQPVTLRLLAELTAGQLQIHTQREELGLLSPEIQRRWLDRSGGDRAAELVARVGQCHGVWRQLATRLERVDGDDRLRRERLDLLRFQAAEIDAVDPRSGEEDDLRAERGLLRNSEAVVQALEGARDLLYEGDETAVAAVARSQALLEAIAVWVPEAAAWGGELEEARIRLEETASALRDRLQNVETDPARLEQVEERLAALERLLRKYGAGTSEVLDRRQAIGLELEELDGDAQNREELAARAEAALADYATAARELSRQRRLWADRLAERVHAELAELALGKARFSVRLATRRLESSPLRIGGQAVEFSAEGYDQVSFELAANPGEPAGPLARVASGGELSRVYLALQLAVRGEGSAADSTLVFDEVDAGIGGAQAAALGRKLQRLAAGGQILAVTHLPQVASHADRHFRIAKRVAGGRTLTGVEPLDAEDRVREIARMLAGAKVTELSLSHAQELIAVAARTGS